MSGDFPLIASFKGLNDSILERVPSFLFMGQFSVSVYAFLASSVKCSFIRDFALRVYVLFVVMSWISTELFLFTFFTV